MPVCGYKNKQRIRGEFSRKGSQNHDKNGKGDRKMAEMDEKTEQNP
jgi:hypothetical protein